jgi:hypothetical protein
MEKEWKTIEYEGDPNRCQTVNAKGQCTFIAAPGSKYCHAHGGNKQIQNDKKIELRNYRLARYQARLDDFAESNHIKSLRDEIGVLRILVEERLNQCQDTNDLMLNSSVLSDLVTRIEKLVSSCHRIEASLGQLLDKTQAIQLGSEIVEIISKHINDDDILEAISGEIILSISRLGSPKEIK